MNNDFDWRGLMRGITQLHVEGLGLASTQNILDVAATAGDYSSASQGQCADSGTGGEVSIPVLSSPPCFRGCIRTNDSKKCADESGLMITECICECHGFAGEGFRELDNATRCTGQGTVVTSPAIQFPANDTFADNICRALDARDVAEQERLEELKAERESSDLGGYRDPAEDVRLA